MADYQDGMVEVREPGEGGALVARAVWFTDPYTGDWEWEIVKGGAETRAKLDEMYEANRRLEQINFRALGTRLALGWVSFEGLVGALGRSLPAYGFEVGEVVYPDAVTAGMSLGDLREDAEEAGIAEVEAQNEQIRRQALLRLWEDQGGLPSETDV